jgi:hypothetical protein
VLLFAQNHPRYLEVLMGCWWAGLVAIPVNARLHSKEVQWIIDNAKPRIGFFHQTGDGANFRGLEKCFEFESAALDAVLAPALAKSLMVREVALNDTAADDTAWLFYTSGTTGRPKGVQITARNLMTMGLCYFTDVDFIAPNDLMVYAAPMSHGAGLGRSRHSQHRRLSSGSWSMQRKLAWVSMSVRPHLKPSSMAERQCISPISSGPFMSWALDLFKFMAKVRPRWWPLRSHGSISVRWITRAIANASPRWGLPRRPCRFELPMHRACHCRPAKWARFWSRATP